MPVSTWFGALIAATFIGAGLMKVANRGPAIAAAPSINVSIRTMRFVGVCETAGGLGLIAGIWWRPLGILSAVCFIALMAGALRAHILVRDPFRRIVNPILMAIMMVVQIILLATHN
jgi:uncharacterized membrane protein YphA (DoxX/SURF4 family)